MNPVVELSSSPIGYNYAYISDFGRYYFINDITYDKGIWVMTLNVDVLATYKTTIGSTSTYILRSSYLYNPRIIDTYYPTKGKVTAAADAQGATFSSFQTGGYYVVTVTGSCDVGTAYGAISYQMTPAQFKNFISTLMTTADGYNFGDLTQGMINSICNPLDYISSCIWVPTAFTTSGSTTYIDFGLWRSPFAASVVKQSSLTATETYSFSVPKHPQASTYGDYCNLAPYSEYNLDLGFAPVIPLDPTMLMDTATIAVHVYADPITGIALVRGWTADPLATDQQELFKLTCQYGIPIPITQTSTSFAGITTDLVSLGINLLKGDLLGSIGAAFNTMTSAAQTAIGTTSTSGTVGTQAGHQVTKYLNARFFEIVDRDVSNHGRPLCQMKTPSTIPGYMECKNAHVAISGTSAEAGLINSYMESGFYYE